MLTGTLDVCFRHVSILNEALILPQTVIQPSCQRIALMGKARPVADAPAATTAQILMQTDLVSR
jgi:hypothetical protein